MFTLRILIAVAISGSLACAPSLKRERAFTDAWASHERHVGSYRKPEGKIELTGKGGAGPKTTLQRTEEGETEIRVGKESGFGTDIEIHGGDPEVEFNYKLKW